MNDEIRALEQQLALADTPEASVSALNALSNAWQTFDADKSEKLAEEALELAREIGDRIGEGMSLGYLAAARSYKGQQEQALDLGFQSLAILEDPDDPSVLLPPLWAMYLAYWRLGNFSEALSYQLQQLEICEKIDNQAHYGKVLTGLGIIYGEMGDLEKALAYDQQSLALFKERENPYRRAVALNNISCDYLMMADYEQAWEYGQRSLKVAEREGLTKLVIAILTTLGEIEMARQKWDEAEAYLQRALTIIEKNPEPNYEVGTLNLLGTLALHQQEGQQALTYLQQAAEIGEATNNKTFLYKIYEMMAEAHALLGDHESAFQAHKRFHALKEEVFNEESAQKLHNLTVLHQTEVVKQQASYYEELYVSEQGRRQLTESLHEVGQVLTRMLEPQVILDQILEQLVRLVDYNRGALLLWREEQLEFVAVHGYGADFELLGEIVPIDLDNQLDVFVRIYHSQRPLAINHVANYSSWSTAEDIPPPGSWLGVPLLHQGQVLGMLSLAREEMIPYTEEDETVATMFAAQAAIAISNARLYSQVRDLNEQLEAKVARRTADLQIAYEQLSKLDQTKTDFIKVTAHELRTPLTVLKGYSQVLEKDPLLQGHDYQLDLVSGIISGTQRMHEIVNTMLMMIKIDSRSLEINPEPVSLRQVIGGLMEELQEPLKDRRLEMHISEQISQLPEVTGDSDALLMVLRHIILNAIKYTPDGGRIEINGRYLSPPDIKAIEQLADQPAVQISISDTGIGIPSDSLELIFEKFYQMGEVDRHSSGKTKFKGGGAGLGLAIARGIVNAHQGHLWAESNGYDEERLPGSIFYMVLPVKG